MDGVMEKRLLVLFPLLFALLWYMCHIDANVFLREVLLLSNSWPVWLEATTA